jgi:tetrapyrrole methylase family protein/MazG family protein
VELVDELQRRAVEVEVLDYLYQEASDFEHLYQEIAATVHQRVRERTGSSVAYVVPGSPAVGELSVRVLRSLPISIELLPGVSFLDLVWDRTGVDPVVGVTIVDAYDLIRMPSNHYGNIVAMQVYSPEILDDIVALADQMSTCSLTLLHHLGLEDEVVVKLDDLSRPVGVEIDHLTSLYVENWESPAYAVAALWDVIRLLRVSCPWDAEQTHATLAHHLIEESHEVLEALDEIESSSDGDLDSAMEHLCEELGDLLIQVLFHANLAREADYFSLENVSDRTREKLVHRHPHVFGDTTVSRAEEVVANWEAIKQKEKSRSSTLDGIPKSLAGGARVHKLSRKLTVQGGQLPSVETLRAQLTELTTESSENDPEMVSELLRVAIALGEVVGVDIDAALRSFARDLESEIRSLEAQNPPIE